MTSTVTTITTETHKFHVSYGGELQAEHETGDKDIYLRFDGEIVLTLLPEEANELCKALGLLVAKVEHEQKKAAEAVRQ